MDSQPGTSAWKIQIHNAIKALPACNRCRRRRIKCDSRLPSCYNCTKAEKECAYHDHVLNEDVPREYLSSLVQQLEHFTIKEPNRYSQATSQSAGASVISLNPNQSLLEDLPPIRIRGPGLKPQQEAEEDTIVFWGQSSVFAQIERFLHTRSVLKRPSTSQQLGPEDVHQSLFEALQPLTTVYSVTLPSKPILSYLITVYQDSFDWLYPIFSSQELEARLNDVTENNTTAESLPSLQLHIILAIATRLLSRKDKRLQPAAQAYFSVLNDNCKPLPRLLQRPDRSTIQTLLLICLYVLLSPADGDIWDLMGYVTRMYTDIGTRIDTGHDVCLFYTVYCLEVDITACYGRPTDLSDCSSDLLPSPQHLSSYSMFKLAQIKKRILDRQLTPYSSLSSPQKSQSQAQEPSHGTTSSQTEWSVAIRHDLDTWLDSFISSDSQSHNQIPSNDSRSKIATYSSHSHQQPPSYPHPQATQLNHSIPLYSNLHSNTTSHPAIQSTVSSNENQPFNHQTHTHNQHNLLLHHHATMLTLYTTLPFPACQQIFNDISHVANTYLQLCQDILFSPAGLCSSDTSLSSIALFKPQSGLRSQTQTQLNDSESVDPSRIAANAGHDLQEYPVSWLTMHGILRAALLLLECKKAGEGTPVWKRGLDIARELLGELEVEGKLKEMLESLL